MKIKDLKNTIKDLPDDMDVIYLESNGNLGYSGYGYQGRPFIKAKVRRVKKIGDLTAIQSRPHKDDEARLALIIE